MNKYAAIKSARRQYHKKSNKKIREYAQIIYHSCNNREKATKHYNRGKEKF